MNGPIDQALRRKQLENFAALLAEKRRRKEKALHKTRGYRDPETGEWIGGLLAFVRYFWHVLEPGRDFVEGWPLEAMCEHLEAITYGEVRQVLINVPPGFMKPVHVDELVYTTRGFVRLGDIRVGDSVLTHKGRFRSVTAVHEQGEIPVVTVKTHGGRSIVAAPDHPFLTPRGWVAAGELTDHDYVGTPVHQESISADLVSPEEARLLGYLVGDGCISQRSLSFVNMDKDAIADFIACAKACGFYAYEVGQHPNKNVKASKIVLKSGEGRWGSGKQNGEPPVLQWLRRHGLYRCNSYTKRIPLEVLASSPEIIRNFIGAYWSCDGHIGVKHYGKKTTMTSFATTVSRELADDLMRALWVIGIHARVRVHTVKLESKTQPGGSYTSFNVGVRERHEVSKFATLPGLVARKKAMAERAFLDHFEAAIFADPVLEVVESGMAPCRCLTVEEDCSFTVNGVAVHNSLLVDTFWPAWEWGPMGLVHLRYVAFSYSASLTERDNGKFRDLIMHPDFQAMYGDAVKLRKVGETKITNTAHGFKLATSIGGVGTGERGDRIILDDPHNVKESESDTVREETIRWFRESMSSRMNDIAKSAVVVIMQRVHENDVSGTILELELPYLHLMIPMRFVWDADEDGEPYPTEIGWVDPRWTENPDECEGELAWPARFPEDEVEKLERVLGPYATAGQLQQTPEPRGGGILKREFWQPWPPGKKFPAFSYVFAYLDGAFTEDEQNDPSAMSIWGVFENEEGYPRAMLVFAWEKYLSFEGQRLMIEPGENQREFMERQMREWGLVEWANHTMKHWKADTLLIEAKANGISAAQSLEARYRSRNWSVQLDQVKGDKTARMIAVQPTFSQKMIYAPLEREWCKKVIDQCAIAPLGKHDDLCDTVTGAVRHLRECGLLEYDEDIRAAKLADARLEVQKLRDEDKIRNYMPGTT